MKKESQKRDNKLRWFICLIVATILVVDVVIYKNELSKYHLFFLIVLLICGIADRFEYIKIPGFFELKNKLEKNIVETGNIEGRLKTVENKIINQQMQTANIRLDFSGIKTEIPPLSSSPSPSISSSKNKR